MNGGAFFLEVGPAKLLFRCFVFLFAAGSAGFAGDQGSHITFPEAGDHLGGIPQRFSEYQVVLEPDKNEPEWWAGAPSVVRDDQGNFWMACRMRTADAPRGLRGYEIRILQSTDGVHFRQVHHIPREEVPIPGGIRTGWKSTENCGYTPRWPGETIPTRSGCSSCPKTDRRTGSNNQPGSPVQDQSNMFSALVVGGTAAM